MGSDPPIASKGGPGRRTLLIVDDEEGPRHSLWAIFKDEYDILLAENGATALKLAAEHQVDAAVLDIRMPDMSGTELLEKLKKIDGAIEVVMLTAYQTVETAREALRYGACEYLTKPFDIGTMCAAIANAMERRGISAQVQANSKLLRDLQFEIERERLQHELTRKHTEIYASVLHDMNNPLTIVSGLIEMMNFQVENVAKLDGMDLNTMRNNLTLTNRQLLNCIEISRRYLSFLKPQAIQAVRVSVNQTLADLGELLRHHPKRGNNHLAVKPLNQDVDVAINGLDLVQIVLNLVVNAFQSTPNEHQVDVGCKLLPQPLQPEDLLDTETSRFINRDLFENAPPFAEITVADNGPGIPPEILGKLFQAYFTTRRGMEGTGLGLSIVQRLVTQARGGLRVQSQEGKGASFKVYLPIGKPANPP